MIAFSLLISRVNGVVTAPLPLYWSSFGLVVLGLLIKLLLSSLRSKGKLPPGPRGIPLFGNAFQLSKLQWLSFTEWKDQFGPIFSLNLAGQPVVVLNSHKVAADLLDHRSNIYNDRPRLIMSSEIFSDGIFLPLSRYGEMWRRLRRAAHEGLNVRVVEAYQPLQEREAAALVAALITDPDAWDDHPKRSSASILLSAVYAWPPIESIDDLLVTKINDWIHRLAHAALPGVYLVEVFPVMKHLPCWIAKWKREGLERHRKDTEMFENLMNSVREKVHSDDHKPCFAAFLIENEKRLGLTTKESAWLAGTMLGAGADTSAGAVSVFILAMNRYPDVQRRGQAEVDAVVGRDRMPTFADRPHLPYVQAIMKEVLRWRPITPLGAPHRATQDDWYNGYFIPKGTILISNFWAINRDPHYFPDYDEFRPERFLGPSEQVDVAHPDNHSPKHASYGFGRRRCAGMNFANQALFINIASILWAVNIERAVDERGTEVVPSTTECIDEGLLVRPVPFKCKLSARSSDVAAAIEMAKARW